VREIFSEINVTREKSNLTNKNLDATKSHVKVIFCWWCWGSSPPEQYHVTGAVRRS